MIVPVPSSLSPVLINVKNGEIVHQRILLVYGQAGPKDRDFKSNITVEHHVNNFPSTTWPVFNSHFKSLVHLDPGPNDIKFILDQEPYSSPSTFSPPLTTTITINYIPLLQNPPLHLAILVAKDSNLVIDAPPEKVVNAENNLSSVVAKFRCAAYLVFRLEEEWQPDTISGQKRALRQTAKIHIVKSDFTLKEILDPQRAQQYKPPPGEEPSKKESLYDIFMKALKNYGPPFTDPRDNSDKDNSLQCYVAGLILDSHWDPKMKLIRGHAALGGGDGDIRLGIFGSHATHAWPKYLEEVVNCFQDNTKTDESILANDCGESGTWWRCLGHALTCPHSASEPNNPYPIKPSDENGAHWHRCDVLRFRYHPCFRIPRDPPRNYDNLCPDFWPSDDAILICCNSNISLIELHINDRYKDHFEFIDYFRDNYGDDRNNSNDGNRNRLHDGDVKLSISEIKKRISWNPNDIISIQVIGRNQTENSLNNILKFLDEHQIELPSIGKALKSSMLGNGQGQKFQVIFKKSSEKSSSYLKKVTIKYGSFIDSINFFWSDESVSSIGGKGGHNKYSFTLDKEEKILGIKVRSGWWIDGLMFKTNKKNTEWIGGNGGSLHNLFLPKNYEMIGIFGTKDKLIDGLGIIYQKQ
ncbi:9671_t:CDS:2 [Diversispora eburnea]|uniref:9671_t:CDS:1 n=1 Tax=Diversispora eburnea TaxID=1213867 RepID=A0A9N9F918_9GLOM|nr:9671_t:CDS:2 [Diversispora eburnea]